MSNAVDETIEVWKRLKESDDKRHSHKTCPLCIRYKKDNDNPACSIEECGDCPIVKLTGKVCVERVAWQKYTAGRLYDDKLRTQMGIDMIIAELEENREELIALCGT
jgi:hypothetical protein